MAEWFLIWILTVETYSGEVKDRYPMSVTMNSLEESLGGKLVGVKVGCQQREKAPSYQAPIK